MFYKGVPHACIHDRPKDATKLDAAHRPKECRMPASMTRGMGKIGHREGQMGWSLISGSLRR